MKLTRQPFSANELVQFAIIEESTGKVIQIPANIADGTVVCLSYY